MAELAHAAENDTDLHGDTDARHWAERFASHFRIIRVDSLSDLDTEGTMLAWFASAIETGRMARQEPPRIPCGCNGRPHYYNPATCRGSSGEEQG